MPEEQKTVAEIEAHYTPQQIKESLKAEKIKWENRRKMAWSSLIAIFVQTLILIFAPPSLLSPEKIQIIKEPLTWAYMCESAVILAYMGFTTLAYMKDKFNRTNTH
jgi:hypothetical protein